MGTTTIQQNILYGLGEGGNVADTTYLTYALRWANSAYREVMLRYRFKSLHTRSVFRTANGQQTYQAPDDFIGFVTLKDESNDTVVDQITPEEFARDVGTTQITDETFTSSDGVAVSLDNKAILQYSETVTDDTDHTTVYTRDTDYTISYTSGTITVDAAEAMADATEYYIDYLHYTKDKPTQFCVEFDATNAKYVFRLASTPDDIYIYSIVYPALPTALSSSADAIWTQFEYCLERGGIYFGGLEIIEDANLRMSFKQDYEIAMQALIQLDQDLQPKHDQIPTIMRKSNYTSRR